MNKRLKCNERNDRFVESLPKIYLVGYWARYGVREYPFTNKYTKDGIPYVYNFDDHNGTYAEYVLEPITNVTTGVIKVWSFSKAIANEIADIYNGDRNIESEITKELLVKVNLLNKQSQENYEKYCNLLKENNELKKKLEKLNGNKSREKG